MAPLHVSIYGLENASAHSASARTRTCPALAGEAGGEEIFVRIVHLRGETTRCAAMHGEARLFQATRDRTVLWYGLLAAAIATGYVAYTGHVWEDYFITFRFSKNLVEGRGLVYNPGDRVHGFTSPIG